MPTSPPCELAREIFCNRTLNLRSIRAMGYDMDYTLIHYHVEAWERQAFEHLQRKLLSIGWPVGELRFDPQMMVRGLVIDRELGNVVKANRFGYVVAASHGTRMLTFQEQRRTYARTTVDLSDKRFYFLNTFFSLSEACMYAQLVDLLDRKELPGVLGYDELLEVCRRSLDEAHMEGLLKADILSDPGRYIDLDSNVPMALLDQKMAGRKLMLITNSEWTYTRGVMSWAFDRFLPEGMTWRELFDLVVVYARKPAFFSGRQPLFEVTDPDTGLLQQAHQFTDGRCFLGGDAQQVEEYLGCSGDEILYVGDHIYTDVHLSKLMLRWRTGLVLRELEDEIEATRAFAEEQERLAELMGRKEALETRLSRTRLLQQRVHHRYGEQPEEDADTLEARILEIRQTIETLDQEIAPLARKAASLYSERWGPLLRAGNDKSHLARQVERHADIYMSRVSNFLHISPYAYLRSPRGTLPHDESLMPRARDTSQTVDAG